MSKKENKEKKKNRDIKEGYKNNLIVRSEEAKTVRKIVSIVILLLVVIFIIVGASGYMYINSALKPVDSKSKEEVVVDIPLGSNTSSIASLLEENGIIKDARIFRFYIKFKNISDFQAGEYTLTASLTIDEIIESLKSGKVVEEAIYTITIPEGKTIDQIADIYSHKLPFSKKEFLDKVNDPDYIKQLISSYPNILSEEILNSDIRTPLEGYLFAATYSFYEDEPVVELVVETMLNKTADIIDPYQDEIAAREFTIHEAVTFASVVENEAKTEEQRRKIAGVLYNRLEEGMKLQTDPTVLYALGEHKDKVLLKDLEVESPYNTYFVGALPIGPISNFSQVSIESVVDPEESENVYYLHDNKGNIYYSKTYDEHLKYKEKHID